MASDTATGSITVTTDVCVGFAEPAEILTRLTPDDLHPARLAGPHAWHPWGLTATPPIDRQLRLLLPAARPDSAEQLVDRLETMLTRTPWPPTGPLEVHRHDNLLDCRDHDARRSLVEVLVAADDEDHRDAQIVTRDGWPILSELAALTDRIRCINAEQPSRTDLADLASWVEHKMPGPAGNPPLAAPLPQLLADQTRRDPHVADRLAALLTHATAEPPDEHHRTLVYLHEQLGTARDTATSTRSQMRR